MYAIEKVKVYSYAPKFNKFGLGYFKGSSVAGEYHLREYDEQLSWHWNPYGSGPGPSQEWIYRHEPRITKAHLQSAGLA